MFTRNSWKLAFFLWLAVLLLCSTSEVGAFATEFYRNHLNASVRDYGITSHEAQKLLHVVLFSLLGAFLALTNLPPRLAWVRGLVWSFGVGAVTECIQLFAQGREALWSDVVLNGVAGTVACWLVLQLSSPRAAAADRAGAE